jgi:hypothetical protein
LSFRRSTVTTPCAFITNTEVTATLATTPPDGDRMLKYSVSMKLLVPPAVKLPPDQEAPARW